MPLFAAESVVMRAGVHENYDRLVMDWEGTTDYKLTGRAPNYELSFSSDAKVNLPDMGRLKRFKSLGIKSSEPLVLSIQLSEGQALSVSRLGKRVVLDAEKDTRKKSEEPPPEPEPVAAPVPEPKKTEAPVNDELAGLKNKIDEALKVAPWSENQDAGAPAPAAKADAPPPAEAAKPEAGGQSNVGPGGRPLTLAEMLERRKADEEKKKLEAEAAPKTEAAKAEAAAEEEALNAEQFLPLPNELPEPTAVAKIKLKVPPGVKFAAFMRGQKFWVVLDQANTEDPTDENDGEPTKFGPVTRYQVGQGTGTAYRIQLQENQFPSITKSDKEELLFTVFQQAPLVMPVGLPVSVENPPDSGAQLIIKDAGLAMPLRISDPDIGDELFVIPAGAESGAVTEGYRWPQLETLPAIHGIVISPMVDNILVLTNKTGATISRPPKGLLLSGAKGLEKYRSNAVGTNIYDFARWRINDSKQFRRTKAQLESSLTQVRGSERLGRLMQLAEFLFAHGYGHEANGWLRMAAIEFPNVLTVPEYLLLRGAVRVTMYDLFSADRDLSQPGYAFEPEVALWRGWAAAEYGDFTRARYFFALASNLLHDYPDPYFKRIAMAASETALLTGDAVAGGALIDRMMKRKDLEPAEKGQLFYLRGLYARMNGNPEEAISLWERAVKSKNAMYAAKAELLLVQEGLKTNTMTTERAMERLERLRFTWRGDRTELALLSTLADLYMENQKPRQAFENWQTIIRYFAHEPLAESSRQNISKNFVSLFSEEHQKDLQPIEALALYRDFIGYSPTQETQEEITRQLIDRLTTVEMYGEAADLFMPLVQVKNENQTLAADDVFRLAGIYLLDNQPVKARDVLALLARTSLSPEQEAEHRLLAARADYVEGKFDDAIQNLMPLSDINAQRLRGDIYWREQNWSEAAKVLPLLMGEISPDGKLTPEQAKLVLQQAVAFSLAGDAENLDALRERFGTAMDDSEMAASFRLITRPPKGSEVQSVKSIQSRLGEVDSFSAFLQNYRKVPEEKKPDQPQ
ncbi:MAG TPA: hypothetical protein DIS76_05630 [Rhodospirillaceae bacterium]|nr:hypothetical protein [Rhodospirillaceae bacterium]